MDFLKAPWEALARLYGEKDTITTIEDYYRVKRWKKRVHRLFLSRAVIGLLFGIFAIRLMGMLAKMPGGDIPGIAQLAFSVIMPPLWIYVGITFACMKLHKKEVKHTILRGVIDDYKLGEQFQTTHVNITHEYGNTYRVSRRVENDGCLFVFIGMGIRYLIWAAFCSYRAPVLIFKKYKSNMAELRNFKEAQQ